MDRPTRGFTRMRSQLRVKDGLIEDAAKLLKSEDEKALHRLLYAHVAGRDVEDRSTAALAQATAELWAHGAQRRPGKPRVAAGNSPGAPHSTVHIVNDDMPFLVDSVTAEINRQGFAIHLVMHPVTAVQRDRAGRVMKIGAGAGAQPESWMRIEIDQCLDAQRLLEIERRLDLVLADVRAAVNDWQAMRGKAEAILRELIEEPPTLSAYEIDEAKDFLKWLADNNFTFLGYREYALVGHGEAARLAVVPESGLGMLRNAEFHVFDGVRQMASLPPELRAFLVAPQLLNVSKANARSTVHRSVHLDAVSIKMFNAAGDVVGERLFIGLFTSMVYVRSPRNIPLLKGKIERVLALADLPPGGHDAKALEHILLTYPRDELFQIGEDDLARIAHGILELQDRQRIALFLRFDPFQRFVSALVYVPRERHSTELRQTFQAILEAELKGRVIAYYTTLADDQVSARVHFVVRTEPGAAPEIDEAALEKKLIAAGRSWSETLRGALVATHGEAAGLALLAKYGKAFPLSYAATAAPSVAAADVAKIEAVLASGKLQMQLAGPASSDANAYRFRLYNPGGRAPLSSVLPMLEAMAMTVVDEDQFGVHPSGAAPVWIHDFGLVARRAPADAGGDLAGRFHDAFAAAWQGAAENDGFNALVLAAGLDWRDIAVLRAYAKYLRQAGAPFTQSSIEDTLAKNGAIARQIAALFQVRAGAAGGDEAAIAAGIDAALEKVTNLDEDRIVRRYVNLIRATLRTNFRQRGAGGAPKPALAFKLDSRAVDDLPAPRPMFEIWVCSPRVEGIHLRFGKVARGGIRWSDRRDDFRTEILGLVKTQLVKNAVIVPVGAKGGFVVKQPPAAGGREAFQAEGVACYQTFVRALLDLTDNIKDGKIVPPQNVTRHDEDDPYLVVAADKGTATFSDIANAISAEYGHWLGDAFASGGSAGYDHKKMAITARGAWVSVRRHFREIGIDTQRQDFTAVGVGDMSGDVFGNGMLQSPHIRLLAAFDHRHIFVDPAPDAAIGFAERKRLFELPRSSWADYNAKLISPGGGVFERGAKSIKLSPEVKHCLGLAAEAVTPAELMKAILMTPADLLYFGGIGTYVKSADERHAEVGDRANDAIRVDGREIRAKVIAEGANLGMTQKSRVEYARFGAGAAAGGKGGRLNTDAIDNSGGVDCSDHEVNIKILFAEPMARGRLTLEQRNSLLAEMTDEVAALVLRDNYLQTASLSVSEFVAPAMLDRHMRLIKTLERAGRIDRALELLPDDETATERHAAGGGLTRPELAVLLAFAKIVLFEQILSSDLPDDRQMTGDLLRYFPEPLQAKYRDAALSHRLKREIIATYTTNSIVNRAGITFVHDLEGETGLPASDIARGYIMARDAFALRDLWAGIESLDGKVPAAEQLRALLAIGRFLKRATKWFLRYAERPIDMQKTVARYQPTIAKLGADLGTLLSGEGAAAYAARVAAETEAGFPEPLARQLAALPLSMSLAEIVRLAQTTNKTHTAIVKHYFAAGQRFGLDWLRDAAAQCGAKATAHWDKLALNAIVDDLYGHQSAITAAVLSSPDGAGAKGLELWIASRGLVLAQTDRLIDELKAGATPLDLAMLAVANRQLRALVSG